MTRASLLAWLESRQPTPPVALRDQLKVLVTGAPDSVFSGDSIAAVCGDLGLRTLEAVVKRQSVAYDAALDLLAADAFVTYAFEAAAVEAREVMAVAKRLLAEVRA